MIAFQSGGKCNLELREGKKCQKHVVRCGNNFVEKLSMGLVPTPNRRSFADFKSGNSPQSWDRARIG
jgi:hypothetical protein